MSRKTQFKTTFGKKLYDVLDYIFRLVVLNLLIVLPSFLSVLIYSYINKGNEPSDWVLYITLVPTFMYLFPSIVAAVDVIRQYEDNKTKGIFKEYFQSFKKHYFKSLIYSIFIFIIIGFLTFQITLSSGKTIYGPLLFFYHNMSLNLLYLVGLFFILSLLLILVMVVIHLPLVMVYFDKLSIMQYLKLAFIYAFKNIGITFLLVVIISGISALDILYYYLMFFGGIIIPIYILVKVTFKQYIKIYRKLGEKNEKSSEN